MSLNIFFKNKIKFLLLLLLTSHIFSLSINVNQSFTTKEQPKARIYANPNAKVFFRVYKINDPLKFLRAQKDVNSVSIKPQRIKSDGYQMWKSFVENFKWSLYHAARRYMDVGSRNKLLDQLHLQSLNYPYEDRFPSKNLFKPLKYKMVQEWSKNAKSHGGYWSYWQEVIPIEKQGMYLVEVSQGRHITYSPLVISNINMLVKEGQSSLLVYVVNLFNNKSVRKFKLWGMKAPYNTVKKKIFLEKNVSGGIFFRKKIELTKGNNLYIVKSGNNYALSKIHYYGRNNIPLIQSVIFTDRPVYRQGHLVNLKGIFLTANNAKLKPLQRKVEVTITAPGRKKIFQKSFQLNSFGSFHTKIQLKDDCALGYYSIKVKLSDGVIKYGSFYVEQYKKPSFKVKVHTSKVFYNNETMKFTIQANYYSGEPIRNAKVTYKIERKKVYFPWWYDFEYSWYYYDSGYYSDWNYVDNGRAKTDTNGQVIVNYRPRHIDNKKDYEYRLVATVKSKTREYITGKGSTKLVRGQYSLRLSQKQWYYTTNKPADIKIHVKDWFNNRPVAKVKLNVELYRNKYTYYWVRKNGRRYRRSKYVTQLVSKKIIYSNRYGDASTVFRKIKKSGGYKFVVTTIDSKSRKIVETKSFYVYSPWGDENSTSNQSLTITPNKKQYSPFDTAEFFIQSPQKKGNMLMVLETNNILNYKLVKIKNGIVKYKVKLVNELLPNITVKAHSYGFQKSAVSYTGYKELIVPPKNRFLNVRLISDRNKFRPGEQGTFVIKTTDYKGRAVSAEYSLAIVDEAIFAIKRPKFTDITKLLFQKRNHYISDSNSINFRFYGYAKEYSLYSKLYSDKEKILAQFKKNGHRDQVRIRKNFKDTAFWQASGRTNRNGYAKIRFKFPDNLTQWRLTSHAISRNGLAGSKIKKVTVAKDFSLRVVRPRFIREKDTTILGAVISNQLNQNVRAKLKVKMTGLKFTSVIPKTVFLKSKSEKRIDFKVLANQVPKSKKASIQITAIVPSIDNDGIEINFPIHPYGVQKTQYNTFSLKDNQQTFSTTITRPPNARKLYDKLTLSFVNGVLPAITETLPSLIHYPYGCAEQTLSTFIPLAQARQLSQEFGFKFPVNDNTYRKYVKKGLEKLYGYQHSDGGWGWWTDDDTMPYMTAYVLYGFKEAKKAGVQVRKDVIQKGYQNLKVLLKKFENREIQNRHYGRQTLDIKIFMQYVYAFYTFYPDKKIMNFWRDYIIANKYNKARKPYQLALIAIASKRWNNDKLYKSAMDKLLSYTKSDDNGKSLYFNTKERYYWSSDKEETASFALSAITLDKSYRQRYAHKLINWILIQKRNRSWRSTKSSALMVRALGDYAQKTNETLETFQVQWDVNNQRKKQTINYKETLPDDTIFTVKNLSDKINIKFKRSSKGFFLVKANWNYFDSQSIQRSRASENFSIKRFYYKANKMYQNGKQIYTSAEVPTTNFKAGDIVIVKLKLNASNNSRFLLIEDFFPAGFEPIKNSDVKDLNIERTASWYDRPAAVETFDDRIGLSKSYLYKKNWEVISVMRATYPGTYNAMPVNGGLMYYPETVAYSKKDVIHIRK